MQYLVAPRVGAWIEIFEILFDDTFTFVAPRVGAWIEICISALFGTFTNVAPRVGAWIEIVLNIIVPKHLLSLPAWERGLKCT